MMDRRSECMLIQDRDPKIDIIIVKRRSGSTKQRERRVFLPTSVLGNCLDTILLLVNFIAVYKLASTMRSKQKLPVFPSDEIM